ncbi:MAG: L-threonylcarbamoyladenylate synthase [Desulfovibrio sp.]|uniref:L-threonylcarbamoyladenylate synthase n=1 Tax=Desulfovibrio TaxID=872 RepID=UPI0026EAD56F|nr:MULTISPECIES: L-threonylcarbamoyladenylate synthase [Desulfovibrio]MBS5807990.1 L-threonylcarbamoyladenylate synthase [Desulfovibrio piger]MEE0070242.1 L-threonylcarbamoyladenylate synthase [Desulfovibrio sp.]
MIPRSLCQISTAEDAARRLRDGGVLAFPTETFYGLGCCADQAVAVARVYQAKRRPVHMPLPLLAGSLDLLRPYVTLEQAPEALLTAFWPGPLTVVLTARLTPLEGRRPLAPQLVNPGGKAAVRLTPHPLAAQLSRLAGAPLTASSANISGQAAARVPEELDERLLAALTGPDDGVVVSGPAPAGGVPSTIVEPLAGTDLRVLRLGAVSLEALKAAGFTPHLA